MKRQLRFTVLGDVLVGRERVHQLHSAWVCGCQREGRCLELPFGCWFTRAAGPCSCRDTCSRILRQLLFCCFLVIFSLPELPLQRCWCFPRGQTSPSAQDLARTWRTAGPQGHPPSWLCHLLAGSQTCGHSQAQGFPNLNPLQ